jgi:hypothetical protein
VADIDLNFLEQLGKERRFEAQTLEIAKRLFIHRQPPKHVAVEFGLNLSRIYAIREMVRQAAEGLPPGWVRVTIEGPRDVVARLQNELRKELAGSKPKP